MRLSKNLFIIVGVASVIILGVVIFYRPAPDIGELPASRKPPAEELQLFLDDNMDYGVKLSRLLAERRIERALQIAETNPELAPVAREVADSLRARLERDARID